MKGIIAEDILLHNPDHNEEFRVFTDASDYQLGAGVILQRGANVAFYLRKLNPAQHNYILLSIVDTLNEFRLVIRIQSTLHVCTDHRNLITYNI